MTHRTWDALLLAVLAAGGLFIWATRAQPGGSAGPPPAALAEPAADPAPLPGHPAPPFRLATPGGERVALADLRGQVVLVNVWATWCPPCRAEMPAMQAAYEQYRGRGFTVLAVNMQEDAAAVSQFLDERGLTFPALLDQDGAVSLAYQARVVPSSFFVDRRGVVRSVYRGPMPRGVIAAAVEQLLAEEP